MTGVLSLEAFDCAAAPTQNPPIGTPPGYDEGFAAGFEMSQNEQAALTAELLQSIADREFTYGEARGEILRSLATLIETISETILPHCASVGFATELSMTLCDAISSDQAGTVSITVHPDRYGALATLLAQNNPNITVLEDPKLTENAAWIGLASGEQHLNLDQVLSDITQFLNAIKLTEIRKNSHG